MTSGFVHQKDRQEDRAGTRESDEDSVPLAQLRCPDPFLYRHQDLQGGAGFLLQRRPTETLGIGSLRGGSKTSSVHPRLRPCVGPRGRLLRLIRSQPQFDGGTIRSGQADLGRPRHPERLGDDPSVQEGPSSTEVLKHPTARDRGDPQVLAGDAGVVDDEDVAVVPPDAPVLAGLQNRLCGPVCDGQVVLHVTLRCSFVFAKRGVNPENPCSEVRSAPRTWELSSVNRRSPEVWWRTSREVSGAEVTLSAEAQAFPGEGRPDGCLSFWGRRITHGFEKACLITAAHDEAGSRRSAGHLSYGVARSSVARPRRARRRSSGRLSPRPAGRISATAIQVFRRNVSRR